LCPRKGAFPEMLKKSHRGKRVTGEGRGGGKSQGVQNGLGKRGAKENPSRKNPQKGGGKRSGVGNGLKKKRVPVKNVFGDQPKVSPTRSRRKLLQNNSSPKKGQIQQGGHLYSEWLVHAEKLVPPRMSQRCQKNGRTVTEKERKAPEKKGRHEKKKGKSQFLGRGTVTGGGEKPQKKSTHRGKPF